MENFEERLEDLISEKAFNALSPEEKIFVTSHITELEFNRLRSVHVNLTSVKRPAFITTDPHALTNLQRKLKEVNGGQSFILNVIGFKIPAYATLVLMLGAGVLVSFVQRPRTLKSLASVKIDTVYINTRDTIVKEKVVYRYASIKGQDDDARTTKAPVEVQKKDVRSSVSMKDEEALDDLLVSGSE